MRILGRTLWWHTDTQRGHASGCGHRRIPWSAAEIKKAAQKDLCGPSRRRDCHLSALVSLHRLPGICICMASAGRADLMWPLKYYPVSDRPTRRLWSFEMASNTLTQDRVSTAVTQGPQGTNGSRTCAQEYFLRSGGVRVTCGLRTQCQHDAPQPPVPRQASTVLHCARG